MSVEDGFASTQGADRYKAMKTVYGAEKHVFKFFDEEGNRLLFRHPLNWSHRSKISQKQLAQKILNVGWYDDFRGALCAVPHPDVQGGAFIFAAATMTEGVYDAEQIQSDNLHVQRLLHEGVEGLMWKNRFTPDALKWVKSEANKCGGGTGATLLEMSTFIPEVDAYWEVWKGENRNTLDRKNF